MKITIGNHDVQVREATEGAGAGLHQQAVLHVSGDQ